MSIASSDYLIVFGNAGDRPLSGDWDGDGADSIGVYRPSAASFLLKNRLNGAAPEYSIIFGNPTDLGLSGDWNLDGVTSAGLFRSTNVSFYLSNRNENGGVSSEGSYLLGNNNSLPVTGDWTHSGYSGLGVFDPAAETFSLKYNLDATPADLSLFFAGDRMLHDGFENAGSNPSTGLVPLGGNLGNAPE